MIKTFTECGGQHFRQGTVRVQGGTGAQCGRGVGSEGEKIGKAGDSPGIL